MPQVVWTGTISFGLVSVPVRLYPATRRKDVRFHEIDRETGQRIRHQRVTESTAPTELAESHAWQVELRQSRIAPREQVTEPWLDGTPPESRTVVPASEVVREALEQSLLAHGVAAGAAERWVAQWQGRLKLPEAADPRLAHLLAKHVR